MKITFSLEKSLEENASEYYAKATKAKQKLKRVEETLAEFRKKHEKAEKNKETDYVSSYKKVNHEKKYWFEKFKWTLSSEGFLIIAGRDATTNEIIVKKHTVEGDLIFHTDMAGSPFVVIKKNSLDDVKLLLGEDATQPDKIGNATVQEAANFCAIHSRAWKMGMSATDTFYVTPDQVSKVANAGESLSRGSFMIRGKTTYVPVDLTFGMGLVVIDGVEPFLLAGAATSLERCTSRVLIEQGKDKASAVAKTVRGNFMRELELDVHVDEIIKHLPSGGCHVKKERRRKSNK